MTLFIWMALFLMHRATAETAWEPRKLSTCPINTVAKFTGLVGPTASNVRRSSCCKPVRNHVRSRKLWDALRIYPQHPLLSPHHSQMFAQPSCPAIHTNAANFQPVSRTQLAKWGGAGGQVDLNSGVATLAAASDGFAGLFYDNLAINSPTPGCTWGIGL